MTSPATGFDLCRAAMAAPGVTGPERTVLLVLAIMANADAQCWPPINDNDDTAGLVTKCVLSERAVQRAIQRLAALGHITRRQQRHGVLYTVHPRLEALTPATQTGVSETGDTGTGDRQALRPATQAPKQPVTTISSDAEASSDAHEPAIPAHRQPEAVMIIVAAYLASLTASRTTALNALWNGTPPPPGVGEECWSGFLDHRKGMPKAGKFTPRAYQLLCEKLEKLATDEWPPGALLDEAIDRNWITVFPPKEARNDNHAPRRRSGNQPGRYRDPLLNIDAEALG